jgi:uncharacterized protein (DUF488 family)
MRGSVGKSLFTIGHSTHSLDHLVHLLRTNGVALLVDVRTVPGSRRMPDFAQTSLAAELPNVGIRYAHVPELGGRRKPRVDSPNTGWRSGSFQGYADHMQTPEFEAGLERLFELSRDLGTAVMCAEALPWRCHRSLIADALVARGQEVREIIGPAQPRVHRMTPFAVVDGNCLTYPPGPASRGRLLGRKSSAQG